MLMPRKPLFVLLLLLSLPAMAAGRELAPRGGGQTSYHVTGPQVAFAGDRFLTVWSEPMGDIGTYLMGVFSNRSGRRIEELAFPIMPMPGRLVQLVSTGDAYALFWVGPTNQTHLTDIDVNGKVIRTRALALPPFVTMKAGWNGTHFLIALRHPSGITHFADALLLDRDGNITRRNLPLRIESFAFDIAPHDDGFTVVSTGFTGIFAYRITNEGAIAEIAIDPAATGLWLPATTTTANGDTLIVWTAGNAQLSQLKSATLTRDGQVGEIRVIHTFDTSSVRVRGLLRSGDEYVVVYDRLLPNHQIALETMTFGPGGAPVVARIHDAVLDPSAASSGTSLFVAYSPATQLPFRIEGIGIASNGGARPAEILSVSRTRQTQPVLGAGGGRYLAAWTEITGAAAFVRGVSIGLDAEPLTDNIVHPAYLAARELAWNGTEYLAVELRNDKVLATRLTYDGMAIEQTPIVLGDAGRKDWWNLSASAAWVGDRWVVIWATYDAIHLATVSRAGIASLPRTIAINSPLPEEWFRGLWSAALASNGTTLLLVWTEEQRPPCFFPPCPGGPERTFAARITEKGELRDAAPLELPPASTLSIATSGNEFLVLGGTTATAIDASSTPRILGSRQIFNWNAVGDVTWDGASYAVALRYRGTRWHLSVTHLDRNANVIGTRRGAETLPPDQFLAPSIAASLASSSVIAVQEGDAVDGARAVIYAENAMAPLPAPPSPPSNVRVHAARGRYEVTWEPASGTGVELYRLEGEFDEGVWIWIGNVTADQPLRFTSEYANVRVRAFNAGGASEPALPSTTPKRRSARH
jgi:hypothetical protein